MKFPIGLLLVAIGPGLFAANVIPPGTGGPNWTIVYDDLTEEPMGGGAAVVVTKLGNGWGMALPGTSWIGPAADQSNNTSPQVRPGTCCRGSVTYKLDFDVADPASEALAISFYADDKVTVYLNGNVIYTGGAYNKIVTLQVTSGFVQGANYFHFDVDNSTGGPTGLDVSFAAPAVTTSLNQSSAPGKYHLDAVLDPVDSGSGQFYETETDIDLGGPMGLAFKRYYSSQLSSTGATTALGTNWMSNFDAKAVVSGTNAKVLLFGGLVVSFTNSGGAWQLVSPKQTQYQFQASGSNYLLLDPDANRIYTFSSTGALTQISDRRGNSITVGASQISDGLGRTIALTYTNGVLTQLADQSGRKVVFAYSGGTLASVIDVYNQTTKYTYTGAALMTARQLPLGNIPTSQTYDSQGRVVTQTDANNHVTKISYDGTGGTTITDPAGNVTKHVNDSTGDPTQLSDPNGGAAIVAYDGSNRRVSVTDKLGNRTSYTYDTASGKVASVTDALGNTTSYAYTSQTQNGFTFYNPTKITYADGTSLSLIYDANGNLLTRTDRDGGVTTLTYDALGKIISLTDAKQQKSTYTWNADGTMATSVDPLGNQRKFSYDALKRVISSVDPNGGTTGYVYDKSTTGPMMVVSPPGLGGTAIYDDSNRQVQDVVPPSGADFHTDYTATGHVAAYTDASKNKTTYGYDPDDRISSITNGSGETVSYTYDVSGRVTALADKNGPRASYSYDAENRLVSVTDATNRKTSFGFDALGRVTSITSPTGGVYKTAYDKTGAVVSRTNPLGDTETITRDASGRLMAATLGGLTTTFTRDPRGNITAIKTPSGNQWSFAYDALARPTRLTDPLGQSTSLTYTGTQLSSATLPLGSVTFTRNGIGKITKRVYSDGTTDTATYDNAGFMTGAYGVTITRDKGGIPIAINSIGINSDGANRPATLTYASGKVITYAYDAGGRLASISDWAGGKTTLGYDAAGRVTSLAYPNGVTTTYTYDADGLLTNIATGTIASISLTLDAAGKIVSADRNLPRAPSLQASSQQFAYDAAGQLATATVDAMGRVTAQGNRKYTWNLASQLTGFSDGVNSATFTYDGLGEMNSSTASGAAQNYVFNYLFEYPALSVIRQGSADVRYYVYLTDGTLLYSIDASNNARHFYHFDEMGNTTFLTDDSGAVSDSYAITPYGEIADHVGTTDNPFTWQGKFGVMQEGTGLYYMRSRHYDASAARFLSRDPEWNPDPRTSEPYAYAAGNPLKFVDPMGTSINLPRNSPATTKAAEAFATALEYSISAYVFTHLDTIGLSFFNYLSDLETAIQDHPSLDWSDYTDRAFFPFSTPPPPKPAPPPLKVSPPVKPAPVQVAGLVKLATPTCVKLGTCSTPSALLAAAPAGVISNDGGTAVSHDGGTVVSNDGGTVISHDGGGVVSHDGGTLISQDGSNAIHVASSVIGENSSGVLVRGTASIISDNSEGLVPHGSSLFSKQ